MEIRPAGAHILIELARGPLDPAALDIDGLGREPLMARVIGLGPGIDEAGLWADEPPGTILVDGEAVARAPRVRSGPAWLYWIGPGDVLAIVAAEDVDE